MHDDLNADPDDPTDRPSPYHANQPSTVPSSVRSGSSGESNCQTCCGRVSPFFLVFFQLIISLVFIFWIDRTETIIIGCSTLATTLLFLISFCIPKYKSILQVINLGYLPWAFLSGFLLLILWFVSYYQRCVQWKDLSQRVAPELTYNQDIGCGNAKFEIVLMWACILMFTYVQVHMAWIGLFHFRIQKKKEVEQDAYQFETMNGEDPNMKVVYNIPTPPEYVRNRVVVLMIGVILGMALTITVLVIVIAPGHIDHSTLGTCPAGHDFFLPHPESNDLDCCDWHQETTCCRRVTCKPGNKPNSPHGPNVVCTDLLGLLNCAPCRNDSGMYMSDPSNVVNPWAEGVITVCTTFCEELYAYCFSTSSPGECFFGSTCEVVENGFDYDRYSDGSLTSKIAYCNDYGLLVSDTQCFSSSTILSSKFLVPSIAFSLLMFML